MARLVSAAISSVSALALAVLVTAPAVVHADPRDFTLVNNSSVEIDYAYVSSSSINDWQDDVLGNSVLEPGGSIQITFSDFKEGDCQYDIKVVGKSGEEGYLYAIDLCSTATVTFTD
ncbi:MAG TPA: hypothetical protein VFC51_05515 [Chloroflexota bacterium]|nr:hypothetical protein [Chloroflexota bacterium]